MYMSKDLQGPLKSKINMHKTIKLVQYMKEINPLST